MAQQTMYPAIANSPGTELSAALTAAATTIAVVDATKLSAAPNVFTIGSDESSETVLYTGKSGNTLTGCTRGFDGTTSKAWAIGSKVARYYTAYDHEAFRKNLTDLSGVTSESTADIVLSAGQQILNATKNARLQGLKVQGRTLIEILGGSGSGESLTGWTNAGTTAISVSTTQKRSGSSSFKVTPASATSYMLRDFYTPLDSSKYYLVGLWIYIEAYTSGAAQITLRDVGTNTTRYTAEVDTSLVGKWQFIYIKVSISNTLVGSGFRIYVGTNIAPATMTAYIDEIRLYSVSASDYAAIGATITGEAIDRLLPYVPPGINGVDGLWVRRYGKNLLPSVPDTLHANAKMNGPYDMTLVATVNAQASVLTIAAAANTTHRLTSELTSPSGQAATMNIYSVDTNGASAYLSEINQSTPSKTFITPASCVALRINIFGTGAGTFTFKNWQLEIGSTATSFQPREDSLIAFSGVELHANPNDGTEPDVLREVNGRYEVTRLWRKSNLVGDWSWIFDTNYTGYKRVRVTLPTPIGMNTSERVTKYNGSPLYPSAGIYSAADQSTLYNGVLYITIANTDSGWGDSYTPSQAEIQAYFNGWKMYEWTKSTSIPYNGTGTKAWARCTDGLSYGNTIPSVNNDDPNWKPYQLLYRLANPVTETVQEDGSLSLLEGDNFIEVGSGYVSRERANPVMTIISNSAYYHFNNTELSVSASKFRYPVQKILGIYEASLPARGVVLKSEAAAYGLQDAHIEGVNFNPSAPYSASYIKLDKSPVPSVSGTYAATEKAQLHDLTDAVTEIGTMMSVLAGKKAEKDAPAWIAPTLLNSWINFGSNEDPAGYQKDSLGYVRIRGTVKLGAAAALVFTLPVGYRPKQTLRFPISGTAKFGEMTVSTDGGIYFNSGIDGTYVTMLIPPFMAEQ